MLTVFAILCILLMLAALLLHIFGLPANWVVLAIAGAWFLLAPSTGMTWPFLGILAAIAVAGEVLETLLLHFGAKKYGGTTKATLWAMLGAIVGAILGAPLLFGVGALLGALAGAWATTLAVEMLHGMEFSDALRAAWGALLGRLGGTILKMAFGVAMVVIAIPRVWP